MLRMGEFAMSVVSGRGLRRFPAKLLKATALAGALAGCSGDVSRFTESAFRDPITTGSVTPSVGVGEQGLANQSAAPRYQQAQNYRTQPVSDPQPLSAPQTATAQAPTYIPSADAQPKPYTPPQAVARPAAVERQQTAALQPPPVAAPSPQPAQSAANAGDGARVTVQSGDTAYGIAQRNGVSVASLMSANGISDPSRLRVGQTLVIPGAKAPATQSTPAPATQVAAAPTTKPVPATQVAAAPTTKPVSDSRTVKTKTFTVTETATVSAKAGSVATKPAAQPASGGKHTVAAGESLYAIGRRYGVSASEIAAANGIDDARRISIGQTLAIPGQGASEAAKPVQVARVEKPGVRTDVAPKPYVAPVNQPAKPAPQPEKLQVARAENPPSPAPESGNGRFRWPAEGRIISGFGPKSNGAHNDGINIALPAGTPIRAAEDGVVAYAGNELKGFGNLILVRHGGDWVTAYAHASEIGVKRGDKIKRGEVIGKVGKTGAVKAPQLHFEVRKGSRPVDPMPHLRRS